MRVTTPAAEIAVEARLRGAVVGVVEPAPRRRALLVAIGQSLRFPAWYGQNLDALHDCLTDLSWLPVGEVVLVWVGEEELRRVDPDGHRAVLETLESAVADSAAGRRPLRVVLVGEAD